MFVREARDVHNCSDKCEQHQHEGKREKCLHGNEERWKRRTSSELAKLIVIVIATQFKLGEFKAPVLTWR